MDKRSLKEIFAEVHKGDLGLFGDPVEHSLSPLMHNAAIGIWWGAFRDRDQRTPVYHKFHIKPDQLEEAIQMAKDLKLRGINITVPHKVAASKLVDELDPFAKKTGAINTIVFATGKTKGFNTDGEGFRRAVERDLNFDFENKVAFVLGAGGTGRVITQRLVDLGVLVFWWNRDINKVKNTLEASPELKDKVKIAEEEKGVALAMDEADLVINATSVGLSPQDGLPVPGLKFRPSQTVFDVIYNRETRFMQEAKAAGATVSGGLGMLVYQGASSFELWINAPAPKEVMWSALTQSIKKD